MDLVWRRPGQGEDPIRHRGEPGAAMGKAPLSEFLTVDIQQGACQI